MQQIILMQYLIQYQINDPANATFKIKDTKLSVPVVTLSAENDNELLEQLKAGLKEQSDGII